MKKKILILGATSAIAKSCADLWSARGDDLFLVGRNKHKLDLIKKNISKENKNKIICYTADLNTFEKHAEIVCNADQELNGFDIAFIAHGVLPNQKNCEKDVNETMDAIKTNALSTISILTHLANYFINKKKGSIIILSSVAGDRGRASNYVYGSTKAMITTFASGLRQRLYKFNVAVLTIKLGFVDTPMTINFKKGLLWSKPKFVAAKIVKANDYCKDEVYIPTFWNFLMVLIKIIPTNIFKRINI
jgi:short-subunit dehydrogenase